MLLVRLCLEPSFFLSLRQDLIPNARVDGHGSFVLYGVQAVIETLLFVSPDAGIGELRVGRALFVCLGLFHL